MRAKVAECAGGHAFEDRFTKLSDIQLLILYKQAITKERADKEENFELIKTLNQAWSTKFENMTESLQFFIDRDLFKQVMEMRDLKVHQKEISAENFLEEWDKLMDIVPETYVVEEGPGSSVIAQEDDPEFDELLVGWLQNSRNNQEE